MYASAVAEEAATGFTAKVAGVDHLLKKRARSILRIVEARIERLHDVEYDVQPN